MSNTPDNQRMSDDDILGWGKEILDDKIEGMVIIVKTESTDEGVKVEGRVSINKVDRMAQLLTIAALLHLEPEEALMLGLIARKENKNVQDNDPEDGTEGQPGKV